MIRFVKLVSLALLTGFVAVSSPAAELTLKGHEADVVTIAFSPEGGLVATGSLDDTARIWDARTGALRSVLTGHKGWVYSVAFSADGTRVVTASTDGSARIWDVATGTQTLVLSNDMTAVFFAAFDPAGDAVITVSDDALARIWDAHSGKLMRIVGGKTDLQAPPEFSPDGTLVATSSAVNRVQLWKASNGFMQRSFGGHGGKVTAFRFSPDGSKLVTAAADGKARIFDVQTGRLLHLLDGHADKLTHVAFSPDGKTIVTASLDLTARIWDVSTGVLLHVLEGHQGGVLMAAFSADGTRIVTASSDGTERIWDTSSGRLVQVVDGLTGNPSVIKSMPLSPDGSRIVVSSAESVRVSNLVVAMPASPPVAETRDVGPPSVKRHTDTLLIAIGNRDYGDVPDVDFAIRDVELVTRTLKATLGLDDRQIVTVSDATLSDMRRLFGTSAAAGRFSRLPSSIDNVIVYYSGHGVPVQAADGGWEGYLLPVDGTAIDAASTGYALKTLTESLARMPVSHVTLILDACFSGQTPAGTLAQGTSGTFAVGVGKPEATISVLSATSYEGLQVANWEMDKQQGLFTWHLTEGMKGAADSNRDGRISLAELQGYALDMIQFDALHDFRMAPQEPTLMSGEPEFALVETE